MQKKWWAYKDAARTVLDDVREALRSASAEGQRDGEGPSGTQWEIEAKVGHEGPQAFLVIEVRQYSSPLHLQARAALAWQLLGSASAGDVRMAPLSLQSEAVSSVQKAGHEYLRLTDDSTAENYLAEFLSRCGQGTPLP